MTLTRIETHLPAAPLPIFLGVQGDESIEVTDGREKIRYVGSIYDLVPKNPNQPGEFKRKLLHKTGVPAGNSSTKSESFRCSDVSGKRMYRVIGTRLATKPSHSVARAEAVSVKQVNAVVDATKNRGTGPKPLPFASLDAIAAQKSAGLDPDVRMSFITQYLGESRANLYRKMGSAFPMPTKRGRGSFWPLSVIDTYKARGV